MNTSFIQTFHSAMQRLFTQTADVEARNTGFTRRRSPITGQLFLQSLVWTVYAHGCISLSRLVEKAEELDPACQVTEQAFDARFTTQAVAFMQIMLAHCLHNGIADATSVVPLLQAFSAVYLLDASTIKLPDPLSQDYAGCGGDGPTAAVKLYLLMNWLQPSFEAIELRDGKKADQDMGHHFLDDRREGALWLFDLGFWTLAYLAEISRARSYFLCRLQSQVSLSVDQNGVVTSLDLDRFLKYAPRDKTFEIKVLLGAQDQVPSRLVMVHVPKQVAAQRRRALYKASGKKGRTPTQRSLRRCDWTLLVTNAPCELLPTSFISTVYRVRWQVELAFKLAKGEASLERTNSEKRERVLCELYAKLIGLICFGRLLKVLAAGTTQIISAVKAWRRMKEKIIRWGTTLRLEEGVEDLKRLVQYLYRRARVSQRRKYPSTRQRVEDAGREPTICRMSEPLRYLHATTKEKVGGTQSYLEEATVVLSKAA